MNLEFSAPTLSELQSLLTNLLSKSNCFCHFINPAKTRILLWKKGNNYYLKIGIQKFASQEQLDRNGEVYWRFMNEAESPEVNQSEPTHLNSLTNPSQKPTQNYAKPDDFKPSVNNSATS